MAGTTIDQPTTRARLDVGELARPGWVYGLVIGVLAFARVGLPGGLGRIWVDDGKFLAAAIDNPWTAAAHVHHGYMNVAAGLSASVAALLPLEFTPLLFVAIWAGAVGFVAWFVADVSVSLFDERWPPLMLGAGVALTPVAAFESVGNVTYIGWYLLAGSTIALVAAEKHPRLTAVVVGLAMLSAPATLALAPLIAWRRDRRLVGLAWLAAVAIQAVAVLFGPNERDVAGRWLDVGDVIQTAPAALLNGITRQTFDITTVVPLSIGAAIVVALAVQATPHRFKMAGVLTLAAIAQWWFTFGGSEPNFEDSPRYLVVPAILGLAVILRAVEPNRTLSMVVVVVIAACWASGFAAMAQRTGYGQAWQPQLDSVECIQGARTFEGAPGQTFDMPC